VRGHAIPDAVLDAHVRGVNLSPGTLRDQLGGGDTLLVFLRHFGCIFCRETVADLRAVAEGDPAFPPVLFFFMGTPMEGKAFLRRYWPGVRAVADLERRFYAAFGVERGGIVQLFGPAVWRARRRAAAKGHENGKRVGDVFMMPGVFLVRGGRIVWSHEYHHAADHPDFARIPEQAAAGGRGATEPRSPGGDPPLG
jgi:hypothetical protein